MSLDIICLHDVCVTCMCDIYSMCDSLDTVGHLVQGPVLPCSDPVSDPRVVGARQARLAPVHACRVKRASKRGAGASGSGKCLLCVVALTGAVRYILGPTWDTRGGQPQYSQRQGYCSLIRYSVCGLRNMGQTKRLCAAK
jgi:hypothetical protein